MKDNKNIKAKQKLGYLSGYISEEEYKNGKVVGYKTDGSQIVEDARLQQYLTDPSDEPIMQSIDENTFKFHDFENDFAYEDNTFLGFELLFEVDASPLFNYGDKNGYQINSAKDFINKYNNISEIASREKIYDNFILELNKIFDTTEKENILSKNKSYYIETITGLDKLTAKMTNYEEDRIIVTLTEDISLRASYLAELYNNLIYSYKNQRYLIPENCLRFDLSIKITDIRSFKIPNPDYDATITDPSNINSYPEIKNENPSYIVFKLHDCNFEFFDSRSFDDGITVAGFDALDNGANNLEFGIKYKSISKEFASPLIKNSLFISNKRTAIINAENLKSDQLFNNQISNETLVTENFKNTERDKSILPNINNNDENLTQNLRNTISSNVDTYKEKLVNKFENIRGSLIQDMKRQVRTITNITEIYPSNVYDSDFRKLSLENFVRGLSTDLSNNIESAFDDFIK